MNERRERLNFADRIRLVDKVEQLEAENERLVIKLNAEHIARQNVEVENARLRELIADVHESLCADKLGTFHKLILASMEDDMHELGIEVANG